MGCVLVFNETRVSIVGLYEVFVVYFVYIIVCGLGAVLVRRWVLQVRLHLSWVPKRLSLGSHVFAKSM